MFSWLLKLLGIEEDKPVSKNNAFMATAKKTESQTEAVRKETPPEPATGTETSTSEQAEAKAEITTEPKTTAAKPKPETEPQPKPKTESQPKPQAEVKPQPAGKTLEEAFPGLKANFVKVLTEAGYTTSDAIDKADDKELLALKGIGQATLKILRS